MSEKIKPLYQWQHSRGGTLSNSWWQDCTEADFNARDNKPQFNVRIVFETTAQIESLRRNNSTQQIEPERRDLKNADRKNWTTKDWMNHVGAWETDRDTIEFGSIMAVGAMLTQFSQCLMSQVSKQPAQEPVKQEGWLPIETAPKDGSEVILMVKSRAGIAKGFLVGHYMEGGHCIEDHPPIDSGWYFWNGRMFDKASEPTHWMPLPLPPVKEVTE